MAISRMLVKPHRVDKSKIDDSSSNERSSVELKSLAKKENSRIHNLASADPGKKYAQRIEDRQKYVKILRLHIFKRNNRRRGLVLHGKTRKAHGEFIRIAA